MKGIHYICYKNFPDLLRMKKKEEIIMFLVFFFITLPS